MKTPYPYPLINIAQRYAGPATAGFEDMKKAPAELVREIQADVIAIRQAAAVALGLDPMKFASVAEPLPAPVREVIFRGANRPEDLSGVQSMTYGKRWCAQVVAARRGGKFGELLAALLPATPPERPVAVLFEEEAERRMRAEIAAHGGDEDAAIAAVLRRAEAKLAGPAKSPAAAAQVPAGTPPPKPITPAAPPAAPPLTGRDRAVAAFNAQFSKTSPGGAARS